MQVLPLRLCANFKLYIKILLEHILLLSSKENNYVGKEVGYMQLIIWDEQFTTTRYFANCSVHAPS